MTSKVAIALGGNLGNVPQRFQDVCGRLNQVLSRMQMAPLFITRPVDCVPGTPDFVNSAVIGEYDGTPLELLAFCQKLEREFGRPACHSSRESRTLDLDLLLFGEEQVVTPTLVIPHPRMRQRRFVLEPLAQLAPDWRVPPDMSTVRELLQVVCVVP